MTVFFSLQEAVACYERAVQCNDREGVALSKLASLHSALGSNDAAAHNYALLLELAEAEGVRCACCLVLVKVIDLACVLVVCAFVCFV